jgi:hypothetical protein
VTAILSAVMSDERLRYRISRVAGKYRDNMNHLKTIAKISGKPIMISEFQYGEPNKDKPAPLK